MASPSPAHLTPTHRAQLWDSFCQILFRPILSNLLAPLPCSPCPQNHQAQEKTHSTFPPSSLSSSSYWKGTTANREPPNPPLQDHRLATGQFPWHTCTTLTDVQAMPRAAGSSFSGKEPSKQNRGFMPRRGGVLLKPSGLTAASTHLAGRPTLGVSRLARHGQPQFMGWGAGPKTGQGTWERPPVHKHWDTLHQSQIN